MPPHNRLQDRAFLFCVESRAYEVRTRDKWCPRCESMQSCKEKESWHTFTILGLKLAKAPAADEATMIPYNKCTTCHAIFPNPSDFEHMNQRAAFDYVLLTALLHMRMWHKIDTKVLYRFNADEAKLVYGEYVRFAGTATTSSKLSQRHVLERGQYMERLALTRGINSNKGTVAEFFPCVVAKLDDEQKKTVMQAMMAMALASKTNKAKGLTSKDQKLIDEVRIILSSNM